MSEDHMASPDHARSDGGVREPADDVCMSSFSAQISFRNSNGYGCASGFKGGKNARSTVAEALSDVATELAWIAHLSGDADAFLESFNAAIARMKSLAVAPRLAAKDPTNV